MGVLGGGGRVVRGGGRAWARAWPSGSSQGKLQNYDKNTVRKQKKDKS